MILDILDTVGKEDYLTLRDDYIRSGDVYLILYSVVDRESFVEAKQYKEYIAQIKESEQLPVVLVGNKTDLESKRQVSTEEGKDLANRWNVLFFETSAKFGKNVDKLFYEAAKIAVQCSISHRILSLEMQTEHLKKWQFLKKKRTKKEVRKLNKQKSKHIYSFNSYKSFIMKRNCILFMKRKLN